MKNKVLEILKDDARAPVDAIARRIGATEDEVRREIAQLEATKTILGYQAIINPEKLDEEPCMGIIEVRVKPEREKGYDAIAAQIYRFPEVKLCFLLSGAYDLLVFVEGPNLKAVSLFVTQKLATIEFVSGTTTHFILKKYKEFGVSIGGDERVDRLAVTP
jgi:DNA-binding Lrp family transcriptional regulator